MPSRARFPDSAAASPRGRGHRPLPVRSMTHLQSQPWLFLPGRLRVACGLGRLCHTWSWPRPWALRQVSLATYKDRGLCPQAENFFARTAAAGTRCWGYGGVWWLTLMRNLQMTGRNGTVERSAGRAAWLEVERTPLGAKTVRQRRFEGLLMTVAVTAFIVLTCLLFSPLVPNLP